MNSFKEKLHNTIKAKNSNLCVGIDIDKKRLVRLKEDNLAESELKLQPDFLESKKNGTLSFSDYPTAYDGWGIHTWDTGSDGTSVADYFTSPLQFEIDVELDVKNKTLVGHIKTTYVNNSPDTLSFLYYHLWPNAYKDPNTKFADQQLQLQNPSFEYASDAYP